MVDAEYPLEEVRAAHELLQHKEQLGKIVLAP
jgi:NADPH:quinone reductase-like Zn-dependent oxidoreductase